MISCCLTVVDIYVYNESTSPTIQRYTEDYALSSTGGAMLGIAFNSNATAWKAFTSSSSNFPPSPPPATVGSIQLHGSSHDHPSGTSTPASNPSPVPAGAGPEPNPKPVDGADPKPD
jgi:hypothetical protein